MRVRALDLNGDWTFGKGANDYKVDQNGKPDALAQNISTRLKSFLGDCFFNTGAGIDWFNLLGSKNEVALNLAISSVILNTQNVTGIDQLSATVDDNRRLTIQYKVQTVYSVLSNSFQFDIGSGV